MATEILDPPATTLPRLRVAAAAVLVAATLAAAALTVLPAAPAMTEAERVAALIEATCEAFRIGDEVALDRYLDAGYTLVGSTGEVSDKAEQLANARAVLRPGTIRSRDLAVTVHGDTAVGVGVLALRGADGTERLLRFTEVAHSRGGEWRVVATHVSAMR